MEALFREWSYGCKNPTSEWWEGTNQFKIRKILETLDENRLVNDVLRSARLFFDGSCENLHKSWSQPTTKEVERAEREKSSAQVFGSLLDLIKPNQVKTNENFDNFMDLFNSVSKQQKPMLIKLMCMMRLVTFLNGGEFIKKLGEAKLSQLFSGFEVNLNPDEYYYAQVVRNWGSDIQNLLSKLQGELFVKIITSIQKYFE